MSRSAPKLLVPVSTPLSYAVVAPVLRELARKANVEIIVAARHGGKELARECLGIPFTWRSVFAARFLPFDVALCPGFYFHGFARGKLVQTFHGVSPKNYAVAKDVLRFDRLLLTGPYHRAKFQRAGLLEPGDPRAIDVGMPKTDPLVAPVVASERADFHAALDLDPNLPLVAYAPTRSGSHGSSIDSIGDQLVDSLAELPINLVVKLHDRSQRRFRKKLAVDHEETILSFGRDSRVRLYRGHDVIPLLRHAAVLVSDLSSVAGEFLLCDRPLVFVTADRHETKIKKSGKRRFGADDPHDLDWFRSAGETADNPLDARSAVERALSDPRNRSHERRERAQVLFYNPGVATPAAVREVERLFETDPKRA